MNYNYLSMNKKNKYKNDLIINCIEKINIPGDISTKKNILLNFEKEIKNIESKNNLFKLLIFESKLNIYSLCNKFYFYKNFFIALIIQN